MILNNDDNHIRSVSHETSVNKKTFGLKQGDLVARNISFNQDGTKFTVFHEKQDLGMFHMKLIGEFNVYNCLAAISVALHLKISVSQIKSAIAIFEGVSRRAEILGEKGGKVVINDFAHHQTAIRETLNGLRQMFSASAKASMDKPEKPAWPAGRRLIVLFEPASSSSKMKIMEKPLITSLNVADRIFIKSKSFTKDHLASKFNVSQNIEDLLFHLKQESRPGDIIVIMSSKEFDGLKDKIWSFI